MSKGNSHQLMKAGANRRRGKHEIAAAKLAEQERLRDIEAKMQEHGQMQEQLAEADEMQVEYEALSKQQDEYRDVVRVLKQQGLLKRIPGAVKGNKGWKPVENWAEAEAQRALNAADLAEEDRLKRENAQIAKYMPDHERRRPGN